MPRLWGELAVKEATMRLSALGDAYLRWFGARGGSPRTVDNYDLTYQQFLVFLVQERKVDDDLRNFTPDHVEAFATYLSEKGLRASSINNKLAALHSLGKYGTRARDQKDRFCLAENPLDRVTRLKQQRPREKYLVAQEVRALLAAEMSPAQRLAVELLVDTALRVSELCAANVGDLTLDADDRLVLSVRVKGGEPKQVTLGPEVGAKLQAVFAQREPRKTDPMLVTDRGERFTRTSLSHTVQRIARRAGITRIPVRSHVIRHSVATLASAAGADVPTVAAMLNHANLATAHRYIHRRGDVESARDRVRDAVHGAPAADPRAALARAEAEVARLRALVGEEVIR